MSVAVMEADSTPETGEPTPTAGQNGNLLRTWQELDVPDGWRAEIIDGEIRLMAPPSKAHNVAVARIARALERVIPDEWLCYPTPGIIIAQLNEVYTPGLVVMPEDLAFDGSADPARAEDALLAVEVAAKNNAYRDRVIKLRGYVHGQVPLYLLVDRWARPEPSVTLYEQPENGRYMKTTTVPFGKSIRLPEPFDVEFDTASLPPVEKWL
ncbi:Uma2 family endonuclease [Marinactinospora rubrisoli]|uniref:Uma2 family endonuclease n=1 Tax=Marinactinospora rubrisoli TaxID=2715399 RepID=A0ABW2K904_9ACTN